MINKIDRHVIFIGVACLSGVLLSLVFTIVVNIIFPQPHFYFGRSRFIATAAVTSSIICLIKYRGYFTRNFHKAFLLIALVFGISCILVFPRVVYLSPDDQIHFKNAYFFMDDTVELRGGFAAIGSAGLTSVDGKGFDELSTTYDDMNNADQTVIDYKYHVDESPHLYNRIAYLPFYIGLKVSNFFRLNFTTSIVIAKIFNLICYVALVYIAIRESGKMRKIFFIIGLLVSNIFLATQFSYDPLVIASLLLAISLFLRMQQMEVVTPRYLFGFILAVTLGSLIKAIYCPLMLLLLMIPNAKFDCKRRGITFKVCALLTMVVIASTFVLPILGGGLASDIRGGNTSVGGQIHFLLSNPVKGLAIVAQFVAGSLPNLTIGIGALVGLGSVASSAAIYEICLPVVQLVWGLSLLTLLWVTFNTGLEEIGMTRRSKLTVLIIYIILVGMVFASMYLSFTSVGSTQVDGIQSRYLMPFFALFLVLLMPEKSTSKKEAHNKDNLVLLIPCLCLMLVFGVYVLRMSIL